MWCLFAAIAGVYRLGSALWLGCALWRVGKIQRMRWG